MKEKFTIGIIMLLLICSIVIANPFFTHQALAGGSDDGDTLDYGKPHTGGGSGTGGSGGGTETGNKGGTGGGQSGTPTVWLSEKKEVKYIDAVNWTPIMDYWNRQKELIEQGKNTSGYIAPYVIEAEKYIEKQQKWYDTDDGCWYRRKYVVYYPQITARCEYKGQNEKQRYNTKESVVHYVWNMTGADTKNWTTSTSNSKVMYTKVGDYKISCYPYMLRTWDLYTVKNYCWIVEQNGKNLGEISKNTKIKTGSSSENFNGVTKTWNAKVATQDLNKEVEIRNTIDMPSADAEVNLIQ